jgi:hypothetical protein
MFAFAYAVHQSGFAWIAFAIRALMSAVRRVPGIITSAVIVPGRKSDGTPSLGSAGMADLSGLPQPTSEQQTISVKSLLMMSSPTSAFSLEQPVAGCE